MPPLGEFLGPLVRGWLGKIEQAREARAPWLDVANECLMFLAKAQEFWNPIYQAKMGNTSMPRFQLTMNRTFEMVATFGPSLYFRNPHRNCVPRERAPFDPQMLLPPPPPGIPPEQVQMMQQQMLQQMQMQEQQEESIRQVTSELMGAWLNYTPGEMPGNGLASQAKMVINDALITGRGVMRVSPYGIPGSQQLLTGGMRINPKRLFLDSDFTSLHECRWIAIETTEPYWEVERKFGLPPESLKHACSLESEYSKGERSYLGSSGDRKSGKTNDLVTYYEVYSKTGPGGRLAGMETVVRNHLEQVVGDYAYLAVCKNVPYPLNAPTQRFMQGAMDQDVAMMFRWPVEYWKDNRWPVAILDFYPHPESAWPIAPLQPGLGELKFLNLMMSHLCYRIWSSSRDFIAYPEAAKKFVEDALKNGDDLTMIPIPAMFDGDVNKLIQFLQQPQTNMDVWRVIDAVSQEFERRTGLNALLAGQNIDGTQSRTAQDAANKRQAAGVRPAYMQECVVQWLSDMSRMEAICAHTFIRSKDLIQLMGPLRAQLWDQFVASNDIGAISREFLYTVAAADMRHPDKDRDAANVGQALSMLGPNLMQYAMVTTDTGPINQLTGLWGKASDMDVKGLMMGQWMPPPPPPEIQQAQQASGQLGIQQQAADVEKTYAEVEKIEADTKATLHPPKDPNKQKPAKKAA